MKNEKFIVSGHIFDSYKEVVKYNELNNFRVTNTTTVITKKGIRNIIEVASI